MIKFIKELIHIVRYHQLELNEKNMELLLNHKELMKLKSDFESYVAYKPIKPLSPSNKSIKELKQELKETAPKKRGRPVGSKKGTK